MCHSHNLTTANRDTAFPEKPIKVDALISKGVTFIDADYDRGQSLHVGFRCERRPGQRIALDECLNAIRHSPAIVVPLPRNPIVLGRRWILGERPLPRYVGAQSI